ncbi:uncharacterized protein LOC9642401 isoform X1 [Selaginella moellendorffii]|uniref:uncharacterized protein LOC9642401 isoform X1 n=1 Tax=Selaginella moellendorffii TaxID=88036 RepID=UPI000D1C235E|nr:uncharacterized protein LOC9642401 isoform X1 [Selaginella moellendorffii]|eukprot:XP_024534396.1 uncharacterized protein LOC9642401 isoform X1 [Selaginella moellendorffii]
MRACRLGVVDPSNSVARLLLEPFDKAVAAAILSDNLSSCLLLPLLADPGSSNPSSPISSRQSYKRLKAPGCSDACFLRAQVRGGHAGSPTIDGVALQFGQFSSPAPCRHHSFFLVASPSPGTTGSCTDLRAWCCDTIDTTRQVPLEAGGFGGSSSPRMAARLDIPHMGVKMVASVNFIALHSPVAGKVWLFAAKLQDPKAGDSSGSLLLLSCALLDCSAAPVYSIHLSMQHLLIGEIGRVRVFPLRPLVKGRSLSARQKLAIDSTVAALPPPCGDDNKQAATRVHAPLNGLYEKYLFNSVVVKKNGFRDLSQDDSSSLDDEFVPEVGKCGDKDCDHRAAKSSPNHQKNGVMSLKHCEEAAVQAIREAQQSISVALTGMEQVVAIHPLSATAFLALDSSGKLQLMSFKRSIFAKGRARSSKSAVVRVDTRSVEVPFRVSSLAVVPCATDTGGVRTLWLSDGKNSVYVLAVPEDMHSVDGAIAPRGCMRVMQVLFVGAGTESLVALSPETVLALSEGALVAYVKAAS